MTTDDHLSITTDADLQNNLKFNSIMLRGNDNHGWIFDNVSPISHCNRPMGSTTRSLQDRYHLFYCRRSPVSIIPPLRPFHTRDSRAQKAHARSINLGLFIPCSWKCRGWDQTGSNGANLSFPKDFHIDPDCGCPDAQKNQWLVGLVNSA